MSLEYYACLSFTCLLLPRDMNGNMNSKIHSNIHSNGGGRNTERSDEAALHCRQCLTHSLLASVYASESDLCADLMSASFSFLLFRSRSCMNPFTPCTPSSTTVSVL
jgi:hypothetical protein